MQKIKIRYKLIHHGINLQIMDINTSCAEFSRNNGLIFHSMDTGFAIRSHMCPRLCLDKFYIWGEEDAKDKIVVAYTFSSNEQRDRYLKKLLATLKLWKEYKE